jgi:adenosylcobyric acid synthase
MARVRKVPAIMLQGTGSSVGKSVLAAGLARACLRRGIRVAPFKPQNMSNNAAVVSGGGGEIGRAQALQAVAAGVAASVHMNPVLLKPQSDVGAQVVVQGRVFGTARAREYQVMKPRLLPYVLESFALVGAEADLVLVEGAGSASEINLRAGDIANMGFARATGTPVVIVGDIDRGGVIASLVGTEAVLAREDAALVRGFVVNRMRGDASLFADGMAEIARRTGWEALGLVPHCEAVARLPAEDAADLRAGLGRGGRVRVVVPVLPGIANFDDLDPLRDEADIELVLVERGAALPDCALIVLAGSKTTMSDLAALRAEGWDLDIAVHVRRGGRVLGVCGGYQMLGRSVADPAGVEGPAEMTAGLGLLEVETVLTGEKRLEEVSGALMRGGAGFHGYAMHMGRTEGADTGRPFAVLADGRTDGAVSACGRVAGTYVHGLLASGPARAAVLQEIGAEGDGRDHAAQVEAALDALAAHLERHMAVDRLLALAGSI